MFKKITSQLHQVLPHHWLSHLASSLAHSKNTWLKNKLIGLVMKHYDVNMAEAQIEDPFSYDCFNDFFTRQLKADARPICQRKTSIVSPCDGQLVEFGKISRGQMIQAKGLYYPLIELLNGEGKISAFKNGSFMTVYLAPNNYHRVHMPCQGSLVKTTYRKK